MVNVPRPGGPMRTTLLLSLFILLLAFPARADQAKAKALIQTAVNALQAGMPKEALKLADQAAALSPNDATTFFLRGSIHDALEAHQKAVDDFTTVLKLDPKRAEAHHQRGLSQFKLGRFPESSEDFDKYIDLRPERKASHWQRGISYYYAGRYDDGRRQFEGY